MTDLVTQYTTDPFAESKELEAALLALAADHDIPAADIDEAVIGIITRLVTAPNTAFEQPPEYVRELDGPVAVPLAEPVESPHPFTAVIKGRASRKDFGTKPLDTGRLMGILQGSMGQRALADNYDWADAPLRPVPSAGGLASVDAYVIVNNVADLDPGAYYFHLNKGLVQISTGFMASKVAGLSPGMEWLSGAAAVVVLVSNLNRLAHKYGSMAIKLALLDVGCAAEHIELMATSLELRTNILGALPAAELATLLQVDGITRVPIASVAIGTRPEPGVR